MDKIWHGFLVNLDLLLSECNASAAAAERFLPFCTRATLDAGMVKLMVKLLFAAYHSVTQKPRTSLHPVS